MLDELKDKLDSVLRRVRGQGIITEKNVSDSLREVRRILLEADVNYKVVKTFIEKVKETNAEILALSGFLTSTFDEMKNTVDAITAAGLRGKIKIMIGGGQIDERVKVYSGADAYGTDAMTAVRLAKGWAGAR